jgi:hypothetical protein
VSGIAFLALPFTRKGKPVSMHKWKFEELLLLFSYTRCTPDGLLPPSKEDITALAKRFRVSEAAIRIKFRTPYPDGRFSTPPLVVKARRMLGLPFDNYGDLCMSELPVQRPNIVEDIGRSRITA